MGWKKGRYYYSAGLLRHLAEHWDELYEDGVELRDYDETNSWEIADFRIDFSFALKKIGKRMRKAVTEYIKGTPDRVMEMRGYYNVVALRNKAYRAMKEVLNADS